MVLLKNHDPKLYLHIETLVSQTVNFIFLELFKYCFLAWKLYMSDF